MSTEKLLRIDHRDNVLVALADLAEAEPVSLDGTV